MSLLNQVLQDLESRKRPPAQSSVRLATASASPFAANDWHDSDWRERLRPGLIGMLVALLLMVTAWAFQVSWEASHGSSIPPVALNPAEDQRVPGEKVQPAIAIAIPVEQVPAMTHDRTPSPEPGMKLTEAPSENTLPAVEPMPESGQLNDTRPPEAVADTGDAPQQIAAQAAVDAELPSAAVAPPEFLPLRNVELPVVPAARARKKSSGRISVRPRAANTLTIAREAIAAGELATAEKALQRRLRGHPADRDARELLVGLMLRGERNGEALRQLETGLAYHPAHGNFILIMAQLQASDGDYEAAIVTLRRGAGIRSIRSQCLLMLGALLQQDGQYAAASESYRQLLSHEPGLAKAWLGLGISLDAQGQTGTAAAYRRALEIGGLNAATDDYARQRLAALE